MITGNLAKIIKLLIGLKYRPLNNHNNVKPTQRREKPLAFEGGWRWQTKPKILAASQNAIWEVSYGARIRYLVANVQVSPFLFQRNFQTASFSFVVSCCFELRSLFDSYSSNCPYFVLMSHVFLPLTISKKCNL